MRDEAGFAAFVAARGPALLRLGWLLTADADAGEDLAQEALARLVRHWDRLVASPEGNPEAYVRMAMRTIWIDGWRRRRGWDVQPVGSASEVGDADLVRNVDGRNASDRNVSDRVDLRRALTQLAPRQRAVLVLRFYEDLTEAQTAHTLGISTSTVKSQVRDALARLRALAPELDPAWLEPDDRATDGAVDAAFREVTR